MPGRIKDQHCAVARIPRKPLPNSQILIDCGHYLRMTDDKRRLLRDFTHLLGPTLDGAYHLVENMERVPACAVCPKAQWYKLQDKTGTETAECFCTAFHDVMYNGGARVVTACDARQDAIDKGSPQSAAD